MDQIEEKRGESMIPLKGSQIIEHWKEIIPIKTVKNGNLVKNEKGGSKRDTEGEVSEEKELFYGHDEEQIRFMEELCIVVDYNDVPVGAGSKRVCHLLSNIKQGLIHRAFSVFLFDKTDRLLLQKRAKKKITFPDLWTNTCCSHPHCTPEELGFAGRYCDLVCTDSTSDLDSAVGGVIVAAKRKLRHELGIEIRDNLDSIVFITRIYYKSESQNPNGFSLWGEHEIDYILVVKMNDDFTITPNFNEIEDYLFFEIDVLRDMINKNKSMFTPWFLLLSNMFLFDWWKSLDHIESFKDKRIHRL